MTSSTPYTLTLAHLYPQEMNLYGDRGNVLALKQRMAWRGMNLNIIPIPLGILPQNLPQVDIFFMGGGQDTQQIAIEADLHQHKADYLRKMADEKALFLTICGGYQLLGHYYKPHEGKPLKGLSLIDAYTEAGNKRMIGNVLCELPSGETLVGFENHSGRTFLGKDVTPLGKVTVGNGNNGDDKQEGVWHENFVGTYLHGPLLPKNPALADALLLQALQRKYGVEEIGQTLHLLDDYWEQHAHQQAKLLVSSAS